MTVSDRELLILSVVVQVVGVLLLVAIAVMTYRNHDTTVTYLRGADDILQMVKAWNESAHTQHKDAQRVMRKVEEKADSISTPTDVVQAVSEVPEKTAERVVEKLKLDGLPSAADSGKLPVVDHP